MEQGRRADGPYLDPAGWVSCLIVTFHGLRHTAASIMLGRGVPLLVVSRQLGHANPHITATVYAHLLADEQLDAAAAAFDEPASPTGAGALVNALAEAGR